jgi:hypothetical protein
MAVSVFPEWYPATTGGTQSIARGPVGYNAPAVLQPQGNYDAWDVVYDAPNDPFWDRPNPSNYPVVPPNCVAARPPDATYADGTRVWEKTNPGAPILTGPGGSMIAPSPVMPRGERGVATMTAETLGLGRDDNGNGYEELTALEARDEFLRGGLAAVGAVVAIGVLAYFGMKVIR